MIAPGKGLRAQINLTPLVDVVLVLLIIFMVASPALLAELGIEIPDASPAESASSEQLILHVDAAGALVLDREPIAREALRDRVRARFASRSEKVLFFDVHDDAPYGRVIEVMDDCRGAGVVTLGIMTR